MERVLTDFVKTLRNANVKVSPAETLDAMAVIEKVGYDNKELLKNTLSLALPKTSYEKEKFEVCFDLFFNEFKNSIKLIIYFYFHLLHILIPLYIYHQYTIHKF